jgi:hypothetical protein
MPFSKFFSFQFNKILMNFQFHIIRIISIHAKHKEYHQQQFYDKTQVINFPRYKH